MTAAAVTHDQVTQACVTALARYCILATFTINSEGKGKIQCTVIKKKKPTNYVYTLAIFPPVKLAKRFSEMVRTLEDLWMVNLFEAGTIFLHLETHRKEGLECLV